MLFFISLLFIGLTLADAGDNHVIYKKLPGFWIGNYSYYDGDGNCYPSSPYSPGGWGWPYQYCNYHGFINITMVGNRFFQHNLFIYPPAKASFCSQPFMLAQNVKGSGTCGVNGGEKIFEAFSTITEEGGITMKSLPVGTYSAFKSVTNPIDDKTLLYTSSNNERMHIQMNVFFPDDNHRYRTAYGFDYGKNGDAPLSSHSMYVEEKVDLDTWLARIAEVRKEFNVLPSDHSGEFPLTQRCFANNMDTCWTEEAFCAKGMDPSCAPKEPSKSESDFDTIHIVLLTLVICICCLIIPMIYFGLQYKRSLEIAKAECFIAEMSEEDFVWLDRDKNGTLNAEELQNGLKRVGFSLSVSQISEIMNHIQSKDVRRMQSISKYKDFSEMEICRDTLQRFQNRPDSTPME